MQVVVYSTRMHNGFGQTSAARRGGFERANLCVRSAQSGGQHRTAQRSQALICQLALCQRQLGTRSPAEIAFFPPARSAKHGPGPKHRPNNGGRLRTGHLAPAGISHFVPEISEAFDPPDERFEVNGSNVLRRRGRDVYEDCIYIEQLFF